MASLGVKGREKSWEAHERDQQFQENETSSTSKSTSGKQKRKELGNSRVHKVAAMKPGLAKIIEKVSFESQYCSSYCSILSFCMK